MRRIDHQIVDGVECKYCSKCNRWVSLLLFSKNSAAYDKLCVQCKDCSTARAKVWRNTNLLRARRNSLQYYQRLSQEQKEKYRKSNRLRRMFLSKEQRYSFYKKYRNKQKEKSDFFLNRAISESIRKSLLYTGTKKDSRHWEVLVGWTLSDLQTLLSSLYKGGMSLENYGRKKSPKKWWELDHKTPQSWFCFSSFEDDEFKKCWSLTNLQPKWMLENRSKGNRYNE